MIFVKVQCFSTAGDDLCKSTVIYYRWCHDTCSKGVRVRLVSVAGLSSSFVEAGFTRKVACHKQKEAFHSCCPKSFSSSQQPAIFTVVVSYNSHLMASSDIFRPIQLKTLTPWGGACL